MRNTMVLLASICVVLLASAAQADDVAEVKMTLIPSGVKEKAFVQFHYQNAKLSPVKPLELQKSPAVSDPLYGSIKFGGRSYLVLIDDPDDKDPVIYVDSNGNGDLTDDPKTIWRTNPDDSLGADNKPLMPAGKPVTHWVGTVKLPMQNGDRTTLVAVDVAYWHNGEGDRVKAIVFCGADYARDGEVTLAGIKYKPCLWTIW